VQTESAVDAGITRDLYVALGEPMDANNIEGAWALRLYYKPFIRWIWGGGLLMMLGGLVCATDKRFRIKRTAKTGVVDGVLAQETAA
jgi:cytochrome c-type biogenesis protein CcmF